jgi:predicted Zn-dependent protease with MMP-like domain
MRKKDFEKLIIEAAEELPLFIRKKLSNVVFVLEDGRPNGRFLGFYHGIPHTERGRGYSAVLPDKITFYQKPIERSAGENPEEIKRLVKRVVWHEIGHHLGFSEKEIRRLEQKWEREKKI